MKLIIFYPSICEYSKSLFGDLSYVLLASLKISIQQFIKFKNYYIMLKMHNSSFRVIVSLFFIFTVSSCRDEIKNDISDNDHVNITVEKNTSQVSDAFVKIGISGVDVENGSDYIIFKPVKSDRIMIAEGSQDISKYDFLLKNGELQIRNSPDVKVTMVQNKPFVISKAYSGDVDGFISSKAGGIDELPLLLLMLREITLDKSLKINTLSKEFKNSRIYGCSFWNTYIVYAVNLTRQSAESELSESTFSRTGETCVVTTDMETSCYTDNHLCIATQSYCCTK